LDRSAKGFDDKFQNAPELKTTVSVLCPESQETQPIEVKQRAGTKAYILLLKKHRRRFFWGK